ncbi:MAG: MucB/RseB C-terminal domain-containing protein [Aquabacterium sp.]|nr:MucB/RseB C-terminal domain-containing protein [Aquabacterium sp.]
MRAAPAWGLLGSWAVVLALLGAWHDIGAQGLPVVATAVAEAEPWLQRIQHAAANSSYQGTLAFSAGGMVSSARVLHQWEGRQTYERVEQLDGESRLQYRHNDQVVTLWPVAKRALVEQRDPVAQFPALPVATAARLLDNYELQKLGQERVAGLDADVLLLKPRDRHRFAQRLWAHRESGLLLRNDVLSPGGDVLESSAFVDVRLGGRTQPELFTKPMKQLDGYRVLRPQAERSQLEAEGWVVVKPVPGFQLVSCVRRPLDATASNNDPPLQVLQSVFSDGLAQVSVFIERYDTKRHAKAMGSSTGASHTVMARRGDWWLTVVGEVPMATVQQFEAMLERKR